MTVAYTPEQDRLLLRVNTKDLVEFRLWLTRLLVRKLWESLVKRFEASGGGTHARGILGGTKETVDPLCAKVNSFDALCTGYENLFGRVDAAYDLAEKANSGIHILSGRVDTTDVHVMALNGELDAGQGAHGCVGGGFT